MHRVQLRFRHDFRVAWFYRSSAVFAYFASVRLPLHCNFFSAPSCLDGLDLLVPSFAASLPSWDIASFHLNFGISPSAGARVSAPELGVGVGPGVRKEAIIMSGLAGCGVVR